MPSYVVTPIIIPSAAQVKLSWNVGSAPVLNVFGAAGAGAANINQDTANALGAAIKAGLASSGLAALLSTQTQLLKVRIRSLVQGNLAEFEDNGAAAAGTAAGDLNVRSAAVVLTFRTNQAGRAFRGRQFVTGFVEATNNSGGFIDAPSQTAVVSFYNTIQAALQGSGMSLALLNPAMTARPGNNGTTLPARPSNAWPITTWNVRNAGWGSQRRRNHRP